MLIESVRLVPPCPQPAGNQVRTLLSVHTLLCCKDEMMHNTVDPLQSVHQMVQKKVQVQRGVLISGVDFHKKFLGEDTRDVSSFRGCPSLLQCCIGGRLNCVYRALRHAFIHYDVDHLGFFGGREGRHTQPPFITFAAQFCIVLGFLGGREGRHTQTPLITFAAQFCIVYK